MYVCMYEWMYGCIHAFVDIYNLYGAIEKICDRNNGYFRTLLIPCYHLPPIHLPCYCANGDILFFENTRASLKVH